MRGKKCIYEGVELPLTSSTVGTYTGSCGFPNTVMYESFTGYLTSLYGFGGRYRFEGTVVELCWECLQDIYMLYLHNSSTIWMELQKKTKEVHHHWILTIQVSFRVKNVSVPVVLMYINSSLRVICKIMTHELSLKVYKVKACLLRLKCNVNSKYKTTSCFR